MSVFGDPQPPRRSFYLPNVKAAMLRFLSLSSVVALLLVTIGCGESANTVVVDPNMTPEKEQALYEDYDKQLAESVPNL